MITLLKYLAVTGVSIVPEMSDKLLCIGRSINFVTVLALQKENIKCGIYEVILVEHHHIMSVFSVRKHFH